MLGLSEKRLLSSVAQSSTCFATVPAPWKHPWKTVLYIYINPWRLKQWNSINHGNLQPSFLGVITDILGRIGGLKPFIFHGFGVQRNIVEVQEFLHFWNIKSEGRQTIVQFGSIKTFSGRGSTSKLIPTIKSLDF